MLASLMQQFRPAAADSDKVASSAQKGVRGKFDNSTITMLFVACVCALLPFDISQIAFAIVGAVLYAMLQDTNKSASKKPVVVKTTPQTAHTNHQGIARKINAPHVKVSSAETASQNVQLLPAAPVVRKASVAPIVAPKFQSEGWEAEVQELLVQITPTQEVEGIVNQLALVMKRTIEEVIPDVEVFGFASGNLSFGKAFGVAVPEVDIVATVSPDVLFSRLHGRSGKNAAEALDVKKLQKNAIRTCTDRLVASGGFKFRRSAFRGQEPKVTLLVPASVGLFAEAIPVDFSVNVVTPFYNAALLTECGQFDSRAKELILLVKRWAKDRGICHAAKGHLSPYLWSLLSVYFLQNGVDQGPLLPPFELFETSSGLAARKAGNGLEKKKSQWKPTDKPGHKKSVAALFKEFVQFFNADFDWTKEAISIRSCRRGPPASDLPLHIIVSEDSCHTQVGPSIEDPFQVTQNLGDCMNSMSLARLKEELGRAQMLCTKGASLSELLEPWCPPESEAQAADLHAEDAENHNLGKDHSVRKPPVKEAAVPKQVVRKVPDACAGKDWRRDAAVAQGLATPSVALPPWRR